MGTVKRTLLAIVTFWAVGAQAQVLPALLQGTGAVVGGVATVAGGTMVQISDGSVIDMSGVPADNLAGLGGSSRSPVVFEGSIPEPEEKLTSASKKPELDYEACQDDDNDGVCNMQDYCANTPAKAVVLPSGCHLSRDAPLELVGVFFDFNGTSLRPESFEILDRVVAVLRQQFNVVVEIGGHSDSRGNRETNRKVSEARAKAVYDYLINRGIAPYRLRFKGYGESQPVAANKLADGEDFAEGRARNRRVDLRVVSDLAEAGTPASHTN